MEKECGDGAATGKPPTTATGPAGAAGSAPLFTSRDILGTVRSSCQECPCHEYLKDARDYLSSPTNPRDPLNDPQITNCNRCGCAAVCHEVNQPEDLKEKGNDAFSLKQYARAIQYYTEAIAIQPENEVLWSNRSAAYLATDWPRQALHDAERAVRIRPEWTKAQARKAKALELIHRYSDAARVYRVCMKLDPVNMKYRSEAQRLQKLLNNQSTHPTPSEVNTDRACTVDQSHDTEKIGGSPVSSSHCSSANGNAKRGTSRSRVDGSHGTDISCNPPPCPVEFPTLSTGAMSQTPSHGENSNSYNAAHACGGMKMHITPITQKQSPRSSGYFEADIDTDQPEIRVMVPKQVRMAGMHLDIAMTLLKSCLWEASMTPVSQTARYLAETLEDCIHKLDALISDDGEGKLHGIADDVPPGNGAVHVDSPNVKRSSAVNKLGSNEATNPLQSDSVAEESEDAVNSDECHPKQQIGDLPQAIEHEHSPRRENVEYRGECSSTGAEHGEETRRYRSIDTIEKEHTVSGRSKHLSKDMTAKVADRVIVDEFQLQEIFNAGGNFSCDISSRTMESTSVSTCVASCMQSSLGQAAACSISSDVPPAKHEPPTTTLPARQSIQSASEESLPPVNLLSLVAGECDTGLGSDDTLPNIQKTLKLKSGRGNDCELTLPNLELEETEEIVFVPAGEVHGSAMLTAVCQNELETNSEDYSELHSLPVDDAPATAGHSSDCEYDQGKPLLSKQASSLTGGCSDVLPCEEDTHCNGSLRQEGQSQVDAQQEALDDILWALEQWEELQAQYAATERLKQSVAASALLDGNLKKHELGRSVKKKTQSRRASQFESRRDFTAPKAIDISSLGKVFQASSDRMVLKADSRGTVRGRCTACKECHLYSPSGPSDALPVPLKIRCADQHANDVSPPLVLVRWHLLCMSGDMPCKVCGCSSVEHETEKQLKRRERAERTKEDSRLERIVASQRRIEEATEVGEQMSTTNQHPITQAELGSCTACKDCTVFTVHYRSHEATDIEVMMYCSECGCEANSHPVDSAWKAAEQLRQEEAQRQTRHRYEEARRRESHALQQSTEAAVEKVAAYHSLGLVPGSDTTSVKTAYKQLALVYHPDKGAEKSAARFIQITKAFKLLTTGDDI